MIEAIVIGRVGVDLTPATPRTTLAAADSFVRAVGGFAGNIGTGLARLGIRTAVVSAVGDDGHGDHVRSFLSGEGIDVGPIVTMAGSRTQVAFFEVWPPDRFPVTFYRPRPAAETRLTFDDMPAGLLATAPLAIVSATLLAEEPARSTTLRILDERRATRGRTSRVDDDPRPRLATEPVGRPGRGARSHGAGRRAQRRADRERRRIRRDRTRPGHRARAAGRRRSSSSTARLGSP